MRLCSLIILFTLLIFSCKKKEFPESVNDTTSDFYFTAKVDGAEVDLNSGKNNYYMFTTYEQNAEGMYNFTADLKQLNCDNCSNSLQIKINDFRMSQQGEPARIDSSLSLKSYPLTANYHYAVQFRSIYNYTGSAYFWDFGDGRKSSQADPVHIYSAAGNYSVNLKIIGTNACQQYIKNLEKISYPLKNCRISVIRNPANTVSCTAYVQGIAPYSYLWNFGDGNTSNAPNPSHNYIIPGTYPITLRVIDVNNDTIYAKYNNATETQPMACLTNYSITSVTPVANPQPFSNVVIKWTDSAGTVYTSDNALQPSSGFFEIVSVENYKNNERGETTKKITVRFKCNVYNGAAFKTIDNVQSVLAVSYK
ncbi:MAG: PKD domain-containing protein [Bacteroidota bacterium]